jgi:hypothetical protein
LARQLFDRGNFDPLASIDLRHRDHRAERDKRNDHGPLNLLSSTTIAGTGTLNVGKVDGTATLSLASGSAVRIIPNGTPAATNRIGALVLSGGATPTATVDLSDNDRGLVSGSKFLVESEIDFARNGGQWDRPGITSSSASRTQVMPRPWACSAATSTKRIYGAGATFDDLPVSPGNILLKYTWYGDRTSTAR